MKTTEHTKEQNRIISQMEKEIERLELLLIESKVILSENIQRVGFKRYYEYRKENASYLNLHILK
jgi:hypothetical protein